MQDSPLAASLCTTNSNGLLTPLWVIVMRILAGILAPTVLRSSKLYNNYLLPKIPIPFYFPLAFSGQP